MMVTPTFHPYIGGMESSVLGLSRELARRGHEVSVFTTDAVDRNPLKRIDVCEKVLDGVRVFRFPCYAFHYSYFPVAPSLFKHLLKSVKDYEVVHAHGYGHVTSDFAGLAKVVSERPFILTLHGFHQDVGQTSLLKWILWYSYRSLAVSLTVRIADAIVVASDDEAKKLKRIHKDAVGRVHVIPSGINLEIYKRMPESRLVRSKYNLEGHVVAYLGRIDPAKGLDNLVRAMSLVRQQGYDTTLLLIGPLSNYARKLVELAKLFNTGIVCTGYVDELLKVSLLGAADIFCFPSFYDAFGIAVAEAMAAGKPIIATNVGGIPTLVKHGVNGYLVNCGNVSVLAETIETLLKDDLLRELMGLRSRQLAANYSWDEVAGRIESVYDDLSRSDGN